MKKFVAIVMVMALLVSASVWPVSAEAADLNVYISAPSQVKADDLNVPVSLYVNGATAAGGVQGTLVFATADLEYVGVDLREDVVALGNSEDVTVSVDNEVGQIKFVLTSNVAGGKAPADAWMTVNFRKKNAVDKATSVSLQNVIVSDMTGENELTPNAVPLAKPVQTIVVTESNLSVELKGATIRTAVESQGIRFESGKVVDRDLTGLSEAGVVMLPTTLLYDGQDLTVDTVGKGGATPAIAKVTNAADLAKIASGEALYATLTNGITNGRANVEISARSYVVINGVTYYSHNDVAETGVSSGMAGKSLVSVAQAIAKVQLDNNAPDTLDGLETKEGRLEDSEVLILLAFCRDNYEYLL